MKVVTKRHMEIVEEKVGKESAIKELMDLLESFKDFDYSINITEDGRKEIHVLER